MKKGWRKLSASKPASHSSQPVLPMTKPSDSKMAASSEDDSIEDEFRRGMQEVEKMRKQYNLFLSAASTYQQKVAELAAASRGLAAQFSDWFNTVQGDKGLTSNKICNDAMLIGVSVELDISRLLTIFSEHVKIGLVQPTHTLLVELDQIQETWQQYEDSRTSLQKSSTGHGQAQSSDSTKKEVFEEVAMTLGARLTTLEHRRPRHCLTHLLNLHEAQKRLLRRCMRQVLQREADLEQVMREKQLQPSLGTVGDELTDELVEMKDEMQAEFRASLSSDRTLSSPATSSMAAPASSAPPAPAPAASNPSLTSATPLPFRELAELPSELPEEWSSFLFSLDSTLKSMGLEVMDVSDAVFAINALAAASQQALAPSQAPPLTLRGVHGSYSAPLNNKGFPAPLHAWQDAPATSALPAGFSRALPSAGPASDASGSHGPSPTPSPSSSAPHSRFLPTRSYSQTFAHPTTNQQPVAVLTVSKSARLAPPAGTVAAPAHLGPGVRPRFVSGPLLPSKFQFMDVQSFVSGPLPSPSHVLQSSASKTQSLAPVHPRPPLEPPREQPAPHPRPRHSFSGPLDSSGLPMFSQTFLPAREPMHKSGPIPRSPLSSLDANPAPPSVTELHKLPPPPLNSTSPAHSSSFALNPSLNPPLNPTLNPTLNATLNPALNPPLAPALAPAQGKGQGTYSGTLGRTSRRPTVPTIFSASEGSEDGESPERQVFDESPRLLRSLSLSSSDSASVPFHSAVGAAGSGSAAAAAANSVEFAALKCIGPKERERLLQLVKQAKVRWRQPKYLLRPHGGLLQSLSVPDLAAMSSDAKEVIFQALASAVVSKRQNGAVTVGGGQHGA